MKRLWEAYDIVKKLEAGTATATDKALDEKVSNSLAAMDECMNDDFNTARVLAVLFELVPIINSIKDGHIKLQALSGATITALQTYFKAYLEDIFGLKNEVQSEDGKLSGVLQLLVEIRKDAKLKKDYATSDKIRNQLLALGVVLKDEKDGGVTVSFS